MPSTPDAPADLLRSLPLGTRVVVRSRVPGGFTDALGDLVAADGDAVTVRTRGGTAVVRLGDVVAAKPVPPAPERRGRRPQEG
ncbi:putative acetyltransferase [Sinomonas atrocyanea]